MGDLAVRECKEKEKRRLLDLLRMLKDSLKECENGNCMEADIIRDKCFYNSDRVCFRRKNGYPLYCIWLKQMIKCTEEQLKNWLNFDSESESQGDKDV